jgi:hypothetical protein
LGESAAGGIAGVVVGAFVSGESGALVGDATGRSAIVGIGRRSRAQVGSFASQRVRSAVSSSGRRCVR